MIKEICRVMVKANRVVCGCGLVSVYQLIHFGGVVGFTEFIVSSHSLLIEANFADGLLFILCFEIWKISTL